MESDISRKTVDRQLIVTAPAYQWIEPKHFDPEHWREVGEVIEPNGGRGSAWFVRDQRCDWVLRHYRRGGLVARLVKDRYLYTGLDQARSIAELNLLHSMAEQGLPVPEPVAARVRRSGLFYRADILVRRLKGTRTLAQGLGKSRSIDWNELGNCIKQFHAAGICHRDLNAHNVLLGERTYLIDFDRAIKRSGGGWQQQNLQRLLRSLRKITGERFDDLVAAGWTELLDGYRTN